MEQELWQQIDTLLEESGYKFQIAARLPKGELVSPSYWINFPLVVVLVRNGNTQEGLADQPDEGAFVSAGNGSVT